MAALTHGRAWPRWGLCALLVIGAHAGILLTISRTVPTAAPAMPDAILLDLAPEPEAPPAPPAMAEAPLPPEPAPPPTPAPPPEPPPPSPAPPPEPPLPAPAPPAPAPVLVPDAVPLVPQAEVPLAPPSHPLPRPPPRPRPVIARPTPAPQPTAPAPAPMVAPPPPAATPAPSAASVATWESQLAAHLGRFKRFPVAAQRRGEQGVVMMRITLGRNGDVQAMSMARSSGFADLDAEAEAWITRAAPLPAMPPEMAGNQVNLVIPLRFTLR